MSRLLDGTGCLDTPKALSLVVSHFLPLCTQMISSATAGPQGPMAMLHPIEVLSLTWSYSTHPLPRLSTANPSDSGIARELFETSAYHHQPLALP